MKPSISAVCSINKPPLGQKGRYVPAVCLRSQRTHCSSELDASDSPGPAARSVPSSIGIFAARTSPGPDSKSAAGWPVIQKLRTQTSIATAFQSDSPPPASPTPHDENTPFDHDHQVGPPLSRQLTLLSEPTARTDPEGRIGLRHHHIHIHTMSSAVVARPLLRQNLRFAARRFQSTDAASAQAKKAADATKEGAQNVQSKAAQGLSRVTSAAGPALAGAANAAKGAASALGKVGGRTGRFVGFVERTSPYPSRPGRAVKGGQEDPPGTCGIA